MLTSEQVRHIKRKQWEIANADKLRERKRLYYIRNKPSIRAYHRKWNQQRIVVNGRLVTRTMAYQLAHPEQTKEWRRKYDRKNAMVRLIYNQLMKLSGI